MKKIILTLFLFQIYSENTFSQAGEWVWIHGDTTTNSLGIFGTQGVPSPSNEPPAFYESCEWTDHNGQLWLFGGVGVGGEWGDLWRYDPVFNEWTWMKGNGVANDAGNYGVIGVPSATNNPPARGWGVCTWVDVSGNLWLFGGHLAGKFNDLWKYSIATNEWTWMKGPNVQNDAGVYGTQGVPNPANVPRSREECASAWTDLNNNLWLFGGSPGYMNDLWRYSIATNEWTWMKGSSLGGQPGVYGILGVDDPANTPGARESYSHWTDANGNFYLLGGHGNASDFNDFWKFNPVTNNWTWIGGSNIPNPPGVYGSQCVIDSTNMPGERYENRAVGKDQFGNFLMFGGGSQSQITMDLNDIWMYCISLHKWVWVAGGSVVNPPPVWGIKGISSPLNSPPGKAGANMWCDQNGSIYIFGGASSIGNQNDLWKYTIDTSCGLCNAIGIPSIESHHVSLEVHPNPANNYIVVSCETGIQAREITIYNILGIAFYLEVDNCLFNNCTIDVTKLPAGIYFIELNTSEKHLRAKFLKS